MHDSHSSHRHLRHRDGDARGAAEEQGLRRAGLGPERLSADERLPACEQGITLLEGYRRRAHHGRPRPRRRRQRDLARQPRARRSARSQDPLLLAARGDPRSLPLGRAVGRHRRHARQDHDDRADRMAADARRRAIRACSIGGIAENFDGSYRVGGGREFVIEGDEYDSAFFDKTAKFLKYLPDIAVVGNIEFDHADIYPDLDAIRLAFRRFVNLVPRRGLLLLGADNAEALALRVARALPGRDVRARRRRRLAGARPAGDAETSTRSASGAAGAPSGTFEVPLLGAYNVRNALAAIAVGAAVGLDTDTMADGAAALQGRAAPAASSAAPARGVSVYDDFAHHPTAIAETLAGVRSAHPDRRIWAIFEPRSATSCRRVFQADFARALRRGRSRRSCRRCSGRRCRRTQRLSPEELVARAARRRRRRALHPDRPTTSSRPSRARRATGISSSSCRTAASTTSTRSCSTRSRARAVTADDRLRSRPAGDAALRRAAARSASIRR